MHRYRQSHLLFDGSLCLCQVAISGQENFLRLDDGHIDVALSRHLIPQYVLFLNIGWVDTILPLIVPKFLAVDAFFIFLMVQFFRGLPRDLDEAAMIDGCGPWRIFFIIILPLSKPVRTRSAISPAPYAI